MPNDDSGSVRLKAGKLPHALLRELLAGLPKTDPRVLEGPGIGRDAALISFGSTTLIAKSDPVTFATDEIGWYAVQVNANDIAVSGGTPRWFLPTVFLPEGSEMSVATGIFSQLQRACEALGVALVGGHTEITVGMPRPVIAGTMLGEVPPSRSISAAGASPGDSIILTKGIAIEGTAILAREAPAALRDRGVPEELTSRAAGLIHEPGISVVPDCAAALEAGGVTAMHDPTEGGLATALLEMAEASGIGLEIERHSVPVLAETSAICDALALDPWGLIASGSLLLAARAEAIDGILRALRGRSIPAAVIGKATERSEGTVFTDGAGGEQIPVFERDEIARFFANSPEG